MKKEIYQSICEKLQNAKLIIVSKYQSETKMMEYYQEGQRDFAENRVQELLKKREHLPQDIRWHMIGHLQSNKVKYIAPFVTMIHSVHSLSLLDEIEKQAAKAQRVLSVCLQFNLAKEVTKSGFAYEEWRQVMAYAQNCTHLQVKGIMVMGPHTEDVSKIDHVFAQAEQLLKDMQQTYPHVCELSMGMSSDYSLALQHGATMIRVGSILF